MIINFEVRALKLLQHVYQNNLLLLQRLLYVLKIHLLKTTKTNNFLTLMKNKSLFCSIK